MAITRKEARQDLERIMNYHGITTKGPKKDKVAEDVMMGYGSLKGMLCDREWVEEQYRELLTTNLVPQGAQNIFEKYFNNTINLDEATKRLNEVSKMYKDVFTKDMGVDKVPIV